MIKEFKGLHINMDENELFLVEDEYNCTTNIEKYCKGQDLNLVIDIGAHIGCFSLVSTTIANVKQIIAVEANAFNYAKLLNNIYANNLWGVITPLPYAVYSESNKLLPLYSGGGNSGQHSLNFLESGKFSRGNFIRSISLPDLCRNYKTIDYLKVDVEGGEFDVFYPSEEIKDVLKKVKVLEVELHSFLNKEYFDSELFLRERPFYKNINTIGESLLKFVTDCGHEELFKSIDTNGGMFSTKNINLM